MTLWILKMLTSQNLVAKIECAMNKHVCNQKINFGMEKINHFVHNGIEIEGAGSPLARSAPEFSVESRRECAKRLDGDPIGDKKV